MDSENSSISMIKGFLYAILFPLLSVADGIEAELRQFPVVRSVMLGVESRQYLKIEDFLVNRELPEAGQRQEKQPQRFHNWLG